MTRTKVSFVVPLFNHLEHTQAMLASLLASLPAGLPYEIILVDDASTDGTRDWLRKLSLPNVQVVLNPVNAGFARANHAGVALATGDVLALVNNDILFSPGWLEPMLAVLHHPRMGAGLVGNVQTRVADGTLDHAGVQMLPTGQLAHVQALPASGLEAAPVFAVTAACCLLRRDVFHAAGGFDEAFVNGGEDIDLCQKIKAQGLQVYMAYRSVVQHHVSLSRGRTSQQNERNSRLLYRKWRPEFKRELARVWQQGLQAADATLALGDAFAGLQPKFLATPFAAAQVLSENALLRQEARWARVLDKLDPNEGLASRCRVECLVRHASGTGYVLRSQVVRVLIDRPHSLDGIYIAGKHSPLPAGLQMRLTITVNSLQAQTFALGPEPHFNVGITQPVVLPGITNCIELAFECYPATGERVAQPLPDPCALVTLTHWVIDDKLMAQLAGV